MQGQQHAVMVVYCNLRIEIVCCILSLVPGFGRVLSSAFVCFGDINMELYVRDVERDLMYVTEHCVVCDGVL